MLSSTCRRSESSGCSGWLSRGETARSNAGGEKQQEGERRDSGGLACPGRTRQEEGAWEKRASRMRLARVKTTSMSVCACPTHLLDLADPRQYLPVRDRMTSKRPGRRQTHQTYQHSTVSFATPLPALQCAQTAQDDERALGRQPAPADHMHANRHARNTPPPTRPPRQSELSGLAASCCCP